ncbi:MAG: hypothetical protein Q4G34_01065 [Micrococcus sp.]|nr:hypothetical protein [Micrococcus sp.]
MTISEEGLQTWARGTYAREAALQLLECALDGHLLALERPWVCHDERAGTAWLDEQAMTRTASLSESGRAIMAIAASLLGGAPVDLSTALRALDYRNADLVTAAIAHATGHQGSDFEPVFPTEDDLRESRIRWERWTARVDEAVREIEALPYAELETIFDAVSADPECVRALAPHVHAAVIRRAALSRLCDAGERSGATTYNVEGDPWDDGRPYHYDTATENLEFDDLTRTMNDFLSEWPCQHCTSTDGCDPLSSISREIATYREALAYTEQLRDDEIRAARGQGMSYAEIGRRTDLDSTTLDKIIHRSMKGPARTQT